MSAVVVIDRLEPADSTRDALIGLLDAGGFRPRLHSQL